jgi:SAM-dependent methyltransferase
MSGAGPRVGATVLSWTSEGADAVEVRVGAPDGPLFSAGSSGTAATGDWVRHRTVFHLQDVSAGQPLTGAHTLATVTVRVRREGDAPARWDSGVRTRLATPELSDMVDSYRRATQLFEPERIVRDRLQPQLGEMTMLDIGIGGGRTTEHFAHRVKRYVGVDFDAAMLEACKQRMDGRRPERMLLLYADARSMPMLRDAVFDFVLFSFNGIDYVRWEDRAAVFREIRRVGKPGGCFLFSTHNLNSLDRLFAVNVGRDLRATARQAWRVAVLRLRNEWRSVRTLRGRDHLFLYDTNYLATPGRFFRAQIRRAGRYCYVRPDVQVRQLQDLGFADISVYGIDGRPLDTPQAIVGNTDITLHYFCRFPSAEARAGTVPV